MTHNYIEVWTDDDGVWFEAAGQLYGPFVKDADVYPCVKQVSTLIQVCERARYFMSNVPTDSQLDTKMPNGDTGRNVLGALDGMVGL